MVFPARSQLELLMPAWMIGVSSTALSGFPKSRPGRCSIPRKTCVGFSVLLSASSSFPNPGLHPEFLNFLMEIFPFDFPCNDSEAAEGNSSPWLLSRVKPFIPGLAGLLRVLYKALEMSKKPLGIWNRCQSAPGIRDLWTRQHLPSPTKLCCSSSFARVSASA